MQAPQNTLATRCLSSLVKVFADEELSAKPHRKASALWGEWYSFQVAYRSDRLEKNARVRIESPLRESITVKAVGLVPSELPAYDDHDDRILRSTPGLYPDPLFPLFDEEGLTLYPGQWRSLWISVYLPEGSPTGQHAIRVVFENRSGELLGEESFELEVIGAALPKQRLIHTEWFHSDCLSIHHNVEVFSEEHWTIIGRYIETAVGHGINMILTPLFTPPLDTEVGGERPTVQLIDVWKDGEQYRFGFDRLRRWVRMCTELGVEYFEFSHLFTQWGAKHAPKIVGHVDGENKRIFGWDTDAAGPEYAAFLGAFLPELKEFIKENGLQERVFFHVSDEPHGEAQLESYGKAARLVREYLDEFPIIDALSDYTFYEKGLVKNPIPSNDHIDTFLKNGVPDLWTYYCCVQYKDVSNRFFNFPSARNRIIGLQLYKYDIQGFLQWGFNFWFSQYSRKVIDPYKVTDAGAAFPSGDAFVVYPGEDGRPVESIRLKVFREALQDLRALQLLETWMGKEELMKRIEGELDRPLTFSSYPIEEEWLLAAREWVNDNIRKFAASRV